MIEPVTMYPFTTTALALPVNAAFTGIVSLREAGDMREAGPLRELLGLVGIAPRRLRRVRQVHSRRVVADDACRRLGPPARRQGQVPLATWAPVTADGLIAGRHSAAAGVTLLVTAADCLPILIAAPNGAYALLHSGWRGTGIAATAVRLSAAALRGRTGLPERGARPRYRCLLLPGRRRPLPAVPKPLWHRRGAPQ